MVIDGGYISQNGLDDMGYFSNSSQYLAVLEK